MELIEFITRGNEFLEQFVFFRGFRFIVGIVVVVLALDISILIYILIGKDKYYTAFTLGHGIPSIINTMKRRWGRVVKMIKSENLKRQKEAVIESGNMVYDVLKSIGYEGASLNEMLNGIEKTQLINIDDLKKASEIKNRVVNDDHYELPNETAITTVKTFGEVLMEHQTIDEIKF